MTFSPYLISPPSAMSCLVFNGLTPEVTPILSQATFDLPKSLQDGQVLVKLEGATLCNSDLHTLSGRRVEPTPTILGHEGCGTVLVSARNSVSVGQRVTFSVTDICQNCDRCREGPQQKCHQLMKYGHSKHR